MSLIIPVRHIGGRGEAGYDVVVNIATHWSITKSFYLTNGEVSNVDPYTDTWPNVQNQPLGIALTNSTINIYGVCPAGTLLAGQAYISGTLPRYQIQRNDGSSVTLRDQGTDGAPAAAPGCNSNLNTYDAGRGSSAVTRDGSHVLFQLTSPNRILDTVVPTGTVAQTRAGTLTEPNGVRYQTNDHGGVTSMEDRNGNQITFNVNTSLGYTEVWYFDARSLASVTDSLGRVTSFNMSAPGGAANQPTGSYSATIQYTGYSGPEVITVNSAMLSALLRPDFAAAGPLKLETLFQGVTPNNTFDQATISSIVYPDGSTYTFQYNPYGEIARVVLPTGGAIEYDFVSNSPNAQGGLLGNPNDTAAMMVYRRLSARRVYDAGNVLLGTTSYTWAPENTSGLVTTETTTDTSGKILSVRTTHFANDPSIEQFLNPTDYPYWQWGRATKVEEGSPIARTTTYYWQPNPYTPETWCNGTSGFCGNQPEADPEMYEQDVTLNDTGQQSKQVFGYDQYNNVTSLSEYDWGTGGFGPLLRTTSKTYMTGAYVTAHLLNLPSVEKVADATGAVASQTLFNYDEQAPTDAPNIIAHDSNYGTSFLTRGNLTSLKKCLDVSAACSNPPTTSSTFDVAGNVLTSTDPRGNTTSFSYNDDGTNHYAFPTTTTPPLGEANGPSQAVTATYNYNIGKPLSVTDANGVSTDYVYNDPLDRLTQIRAAPGTAAEDQTNVTYTGATQVDIKRSLTSASTASSSIHTTTLYDGFGRTKETRTYEDSGYITSSRFYDALGRLSSASNPYRVGSSAWDAAWGSQYFTSYAYDTASRPLSVTLPDSAATTTSYLGNQTTVADQAQRKRTTTTDALGRISGVVEDPSATGYTGLNYITIYAYNALDDLLCVNQGGSAAVGGSCNASAARARSFTYDPLGRLIAANNPENSSATHPAAQTCSGVSGLWTTCYTYDAGGNLQTKTDNRSIQTTYTYDPLNRILSKSYSDGTPPVSYAYDITPTGITPAVSNPVGRLTQVARSGVSTTNMLAYDPLGRSTKSSQVTAGATFTFQYQYNNAGSLTSEILPSNRTIAISYDAANRPATLQGVLGTTTTDYIGNPLVTYAAGDFTNSIQYVPHGAVWAYTRGDGITRAEEYNNRLQSIESYYSLGNTNDAAHMLFVSCPHWGSGSVGQISKICPDGPAVNNNGNLVAYDEYLGTPGASAYTHFAQASPGSSTITYDALNRLTAMNDTGGWSRGFQYDQWGNMSVTAATGMTPLNNNAPQQPPSAIYNANNQRTDAGLGYDASGNVNAMNQFSGITYDAENHLLTASSPTPVSYQYDGEGRRVTKTGAGNSTVYVYDASGELAAEYNTTPPPTSQCMTCYLSYDYLGSVRMVTTGPTGAVVSRHDFLPFGEEMTTAVRPSALGFQGTDDVTQRFTGKERDAESGLDYFGARYYGSALGRFTSPDWSASPEPVPYAELSDPQSLNLYAYTRNNPLGRTDADGHCTVDGEQHFGWCIWHTLGFYETEVDRVNDARSFFTNNSVIINGQSVDPSKLTDKQVLSAFQLYNDVYRDSGGAQNPGLAATKMLPGAGLKYEANPKHGTTARGNVSPEPTNPEATLANSVPVKNSSTARVGVDPSTGEYVMFRETGSGNSTYHGYAVKSFNDLPNEAKAALQDAGMVSQRGKIR
jgi:RHS repeat-associated protein